MRWNKLWKKSESLWHCGTSVLAALFKLTLPNLFLSSQTSTRYTILKRRTNSCLSSFLVFETAHAQHVKSYISSALHWWRPFYIYNESSGTNKPYVWGWSEICDVPAAQRFEIFARQHDIASWYAIPTCFDVEKIWLIYHDFGRLEGKLPRLVPGLAN